MESLEQLIKWSNHSNIVIVGGGPSLDFCMDEIACLANEDTVFLLTDIVSSNFVKLFPNTDRLIFTVEARRHNYLKGLVNERIACYCNADKKNINTILNQCYSFHFDIDKGKKHSFAMKSPGTVAGAAIYWALFIADFFKNKSRLFLFGIDLSYIDNQVYNRLCKFSFEHNYWNNRESREWNAILKKTSNIVYRDGYIIRSSHEFLRTKEKLEILMENTQNSTIQDYSPMGISENFVKKVIPRKINSDINRDIIR